MASLPPELSARLTETSDRAGLRHLALHGGLIGIVGALIAVGVPFWGALLPVQGTLLCFLFTLEHEATHRTPFASERLNERVGRAVGVLIFLPFEWFRYFHLAHHRWTNIPGKDPELEGGAKPEDWRAYLIHVSGLPYWASMLRQISINALGRAEAAYLPPRALPRITREARAMLGLYTLAVLSLSVSSLLFWVWLLPLLLGQPFLRLYLLAEHGRCAFVANMFENTRTTFTNRVVRFLAWNMPYHTEHHVYPAVPFHRLPDLHRVMAAHLGVTSPGYVAFTKEFAGSLGDRQR